jgi:thioredoxin reductase
MTPVSSVPGVAELVGRGVYCGMPKEVPQPVRDRHAVVVGEPATCAIAARQLGAGGWKVTVVTRESGCGAGVRRECRRRHGTELVCATGVEYLEAIVLRRIATGRIEACNASALFIMSAHDGSQFVQGNQRTDSRISAVPINPRHPSGRYRLKSQRHSKGSTSCATE